jgi:hypothetical protein
MPLSLAAVSPQTALGIFSPPLRIEQASAYLRVAPVQAVPPNVERDREPLPSPTQNDADEQ